MVSVEPGCETESGTFLRLQELTLFPIDTSPLKTELMSGKEIGWLNTYHQTALQKRSPLLEPDEIEWLKQKTRPVIPRA